jgi:phosphosulfolactate phosphohydrolase-like enzyme
LKNRDIVVIVDTLRFSSAVVTAVAHGFTIYPVCDHESGKALAAQINAELAGRPGKAVFSISPRSFINAPPTSNRKVVLFSPNGATCSTLAGKDDTVYIGCLLNARSIGAHLSKIAQESGQNVTIVAAGEQRAIDTGERIVYDIKAGYPVFAVEDYFACGAIIHHSHLNKSAEARVCETTYRASHEEIVDYLLESFSGRYLVQHDLKEDVNHAAQLNLYDVIPVVCDGKITRLSIL